MIPLTKIICQQIKRISSYILICLIIYFTCLADLFAQQNHSALKKDWIVVIDPGHGGLDPGALGSSIKEKEVVLGIALKLGSLIEKNFDDVKVIYTRDKDIFIPLDQRAEIANKNHADLFISIHANWFQKKTSYGTETFVMGPHKNDANFEVAKLENSVITLEEDYSTKYEGFDPKSLDSYIIFTLLQTTYQDQSLYLAKLIQDEFREKAKRFDRGVKQAGFWVLWKTTMPSILVETGFLSNEQEEKYLKSEEGQTYLASAIFRAFREYKESIERSSNFESIDKSEIDLKNSIESPEKINFDNSELYFKVQVFSSRKPITADADYFKNFTDVEEFKSGKWFKYAVGKENSYKNIISLCSEVKKIYPDAFVIAIKNGEIIPLKDAIEEINNKL
jgi:N-acetylmuramoyl-L-alanine amidase